MMSTWQEFTHGTVLAPAVAATGGHHESAPQQGPPVAVGAGGQSQDGSLMQRLFSHFADAKAPGCLTTDQLQLKRSNEANESKQAPAAREKSLPTSTIVGSREPATRDPYPGPKHDGYGGSLDRAFDLDPRLGFRDSIMQKMYGPNGWAAPKASENPFLQFLHGLGGAALALPAVIGGEVLDLVNGGEIHGFQMSNIEQSRRDYEKTHPEAREPPK